MNHSIVFAYYGNKTKLEPAVFSYFRDFMEKNKF